MPLNKSFFKLLLKPFLKRKKRIKHLRSQFNFAERWKLQISSEDKSAWSTQRTGWIISTLIVISLLGGIPWIIDSVIKTNINQVDQQIQSLNEINNKVRQRNTALTHIQNLNQLDELIKKTNKDPGPVLEKLKDILPSGVGISSFALGGDNTLVLKMVSPTPIDVARLWVSLQDSGLFQGVDLPSVSLQDKTQLISLTLKLK